MTKNAKKILKAVDSAKPMYRSRFRVKAYTPDKQSVWNDKLLPMHVNRVDFFADDRLSITFTDTDQFCFYKHCRLREYGRAMGCVVTLDIEMCDFDTGRPIDVCRYNVWVTVRLPERSSLSHECGDSTNWPAATRVTAGILDTGSPDEIRRVTTGDMKNILDSIHNITYDKEFVQVRNCYWAYRDNLEKSKATTV